MRSLHAMRAVDTNIVVRLFVADDADQFAATTALFRDHMIHVPVTVILETEWVLRRAYRLSRAMIVEHFRNLGGVPNVELEDAGSVSIAVDMMERGSDFADALHLVRCANCTDFVTFDQALAKSAPANVTLLT